MRHILVNAARRKLAGKHGGGRDAAALDDRDLAVERAHYEEILDVGEALERLWKLDERLCRLVECRFYAGMTEAETAVALGVSDRTVRREWLRARAWLKSELGYDPACGRGENAMSEDESRLARPRPPRCVRARPRLRRAPRSRAGSAARRLAGIADAGRRAELASLLTAALEDDGFLRPGGALRG